MKKSCCRYRPSLAGLISGLFVAVSANTAALVASEPVPYFSITWSATATGVSDTTDDTGTRTVEQRRVVMTGSAIMRLYADGSLDGSFDDYPFELSVTDEDDIVETTPCGGDGGFRRSHSFFHITDPNRYALLPGPHHDIVIQEPLQRPDGSWYLLDPFNGFYVNRLFTYRFDYDLTDCNGDANADTNTGLSALYLVLGEPANTI